MNEIASSIVTVAQSHLLSDHAFNCIRLLQDEPSFVAPWSPPHQAGRWMAASAAASICMCMFASGSVLSESLLDDGLFPLRYRRFFSLLLSRTRHLMLDPTKRFCENVHGDSCSGSPSDCMVRNIHIFSANLRDLLALYARVFTIPLVASSVRRLSASHCTNSISQLASHALAVYARDVSVATLRLSLGVLCAHAYLTLVDAFRCPVRADYHLASAVATGFLLIGEAPARRLLITRHCTALFLCMLVGKSPLKRHRVWRFLFAMLLARSLWTRGIARTACSIAI